jgi:hypothetical protein
VIARQDNSGTLCENQPDERDADLKEEAANHDGSERQKRMRRLKMRTGRRPSDTRGAGGTLLFSAGRRRPRIVTEASISHPRPVVIEKSEFEFVTHSESRSSVSVFAS